MNSDRSYDYHKSFSDMTRWARVLRNIPVLGGTALHFERVPSVDNLQVSRLGNPPSDGLQK